MTFGEIARKRLHPLFLLIAALVLLPAGSALAAVATPLPAAPSVAAPATAATPPTAAAVAPTATAAVTPASVGASAYKPLGPEWIKGQPTAGAFGFQKQYSHDGKYALWMHNVVLMPVITVISLLVLGLLLWVIAFFRRSRNAVPSKTSHNTVIEVIWTVVPALVLVAIAFPSMILLNNQFRSAPADALTIKVTGYQWYWGYTYPDNGGFEVISNMLPDAEAEKRGEPAHLGADNRLVVPVGEPIRVQVTGADVIHSFAVPSLWFKIDAVPGRLNERVMQVDEPGIYYGQCSELCGARHGYMPIVVEAVTRPQFEAYLRSQGGTVGKATAAPAAAKPAAAEPAADKPAEPAAAATPAATQA